MNGALSPGEPLPSMRALAKSVQGQLRWFSSKSPVPSGTWINEKLDLHLVRNNSDTVAMNLSEMKLLGAHNRENIATAAAAVMELVTPETIRGVASEFTGVEHRIEFVTERAGVRWFNDSIGTSPTRTIAGLRSFDHKIILLAGGYDKKIPYDVLAPEILRHVRVLLLCGDTAPIIRQAVESHPDFPNSGLVIEMTDNLTQSVGQASEIATEGDIVMLSPASASFDAYPNFEERGRHFKQLVLALDEGRG